MMRTILTAFLLFGVLVTASKSDQVLYDATQSVGSGGFAGHDELGQTIQLSQPSVISQFALSVESGPVFSFVDDLNLRLYVASSFGGIPADLLWLGTLEDVTLSRGFDIFTIDVPNVVVPRAFAYTVELVHRKDLSIILHSGSDPAPAGLAGNLIDWNAARNEWHIVPASNPLAVKFVGTPIPEPTAGATILLICSVATVARWRRAM